MRQGRDGAGMWQEAAVSTVLFQRLYSMVHGPAAPSRGTPVHYRSLVSCKHETLSEAREGRAVTHLA